MDSFSDHCPCQFREHKGRRCPPGSQDLHYNRHSIIVLEPSTAPSCPGPPTQLTQNPVHLLSQTWPVGSGNRGCPSQEAPAGNSEVCPHRRSGRCGIPPKSCTAAACREHSALMNESTLGQLPLPPPKPHSPCKAKNQTKKTSIKQIKKPAR